MEAKLGRTVRLLVRSVLTRDADALRYIYDPEPEAVPQLPPSEIALRGRVGSVVARRLSEYPGTRVLETNLSDANGAGTVNVTVEAPRPITPEEVLPLQNDLQKYVLPSLTVRVRTRVVGVAGADGWVVDAPGTSSE